MSSLGTDGERHIHDTTLAFGRDVTKKSLVSAPPRCDATAEPSLAAHYGVSGYPTLLWFPRGAAHPKYGEPYDGILDSAAALAAWVERRSGLVDATEGSSGAPINMLGYRPYVAPQPWALELVPETFDSVAYDSSRAVLVGTSPP